MITRGDSMPRKKKETNLVERQFLYELWELDIEGLKQHLFALNDALLYHREKVADGERYKYRIETMMKIKQWLDREDKIINEK